MHELKYRFKNRRLALRLTRDGLAKRSGVSTSSIKRFEVTGQIALASLLKLSLVLGCLDSFEQLAQPPVASSQPLDRILEAKKPPKRGTIS